MWEQSTNITNKTNAMIYLKISEAQLHGHFESSILLYDKNDF